MTETQTHLHLLLVDDEDAFRRATTQVLERRGFTVAEAANGLAALEMLDRARPDIVLLDLRMPGLSGIETLQEIRRLHGDLPVIILTGHGDFDAAVASIKLEVVDFLQKPFDVDQLGTHIRRLLQRGTERSLRERSIAELMAPPSAYPRLYGDDPVSLALDTLCTSFFRPAERDRNDGQLRSALVYDRQERFLGLIRFADLLKLVLPPFLENSPYTTYFTGMFLAQCKLIGRRNLRDLMEDPVSVDADAPLMEAVHLMIEHHLVNLPVMKGGTLVGILRERDIILEIARNA